MASRYEQAHHIETISLSANQANIEFSDIPQIYTDLIIVGKLRSARANETDVLTMQVGNGTVDTGANYDWYEIRVGTQGSNNDDAQGDTSAQVAGLAMAASGTADMFSQHEIVVLEYTDSSINRNIVAECISAPSGTTPTYNYMHNHAMWKNTADAIDIIEFSFSNGDFVSGSYLALYGRGSV